MASLHSAALRRRLDALAEAVRRTIEHRERMREYAKAAASIRAALAEADIDPAQNPGVRHFNQGEREVSEWPDTPELQRADAAYIAQHPDLAARESLAGRAGSRAARFAGQPAPEPWTLSPLDWYAWSLAARSDPAPDPQ